MTIYRLPPSNSTNMRRLLYLLYLSMLCVPAMPQQFLARVLDKQTGQALAEVDVVRFGYLVAQTDASGRLAFSLKSKPREALVTLFGVGYQAKQVTLRADADTTLYLEPLSKHLAEQVVVGSRTKRGNSTYSYAPDNVKNLITLAGEPDIVRYMQVLPGISQGMEGGMSYYVRGANSGNNRIELDGIPITSPTHLFGLMSSFHTDIVDRANFQMGGVSASSGDFLGSLLQMQTVTPGKQRHRGSVSLSTLMLSGSLQGNLWRDKISYQVAGRTSLIGPLGRFIAKGSDSPAQFTAEVVDLYAKVHYQINPKNALSLLYYDSHDLFVNERELTRDAGGDFAFGWDNRAIQARWMHQVDDRLSSQTSVYYSGFTAHRRDRQVAPSERKELLLRVSSTKDEVAWRQRFDYHRGALSANAGGDYRHLRFRPATQYVALSEQNSVHRTEESRTNLASAFVEGEYEQSELYKLRAGLRYNLFNSANLWLNDLEARLYASRMLTHSIGLEATYDYMSQFSHTLEGMPIGWSMDLIVPATKDFRPEHAHQVYLGGFWGSQDYSASLGAYYKHLSRLVSYVSMLNYLSPYDVSWQDDVDSGTGASYGLEAWLEKKHGRLTGTLSYTLSKTTRQFEKLNSGKVFPFKFDRLHNLNLQMRYIFAQGKKSHHALNLAFAWSSGNRTTIPVAMYKAENLPYWQSQGGGIAVSSDESYHASVRLEMSEMNAFKLPDYMRLDLGYIYQFRGRRLEHEFSLSVLNALNRHNPYLYFYEKGQWRQMSILPVVPSIGWRIKF